MILDGDRNESVVLIGPRRLGSTLAIGWREGIALAGLLLVGLALSYRLARRLGGQHEEIARQALSDPLTGLWNRRRLGELLEQEVDRARRFGHPLSLLIVDVDDFKRINDERGHPHGDGSCAASARSCARRPATSTWPPATAATSWR